MADKLTHWKKLQNPDYLGSYDFQPGEERIVTIESVKREMITGPEGKKEECTVVYLVGSKPLILNATNGKAITKAIGTPYVQEWGGKRVTLHVQKIKAFGEMVDALRVKPNAPAKQKLETGSDRWLNLVKSIKSDPSNLAKAEEFYALTPEQVELLRKEAKGE
jgi:hypothetical protein